MKVLLDTNILISAFIFGGQAARVLDAMIDAEFEIYVSDYVDCEFRDKLQLKWADKVDAVYNAYRKYNFKFCKSTAEKLGELRDKKDIPVLSDALYHNVDIILTGDKDFLEANLERPIIFSPTMMLEFLFVNNLL